MTAREQAQAWTSMVWGDREGFACLAIGFGPHYDTNGKYKHRDFQHGFHRWPDHAEKLLDRAMEYAPTADVYIAPLLRTSFARTKDTALPGTVLWADIDQVSPEISGFDRALIGPGGMLIDSGRGRHVYLRLPEPLDPTEIERWNRRLARRLGADAKWDAAAVLRLPGTYNHKEAARGGDLLPVTVLNGGRARRDWTLDELAQLLPDIPNIAIASVEDAITPSMPKTVPAHLLARLDEEPVDRSAQMSTFVGACLKAGLSDSETLALTLEHKPTKAKYIDGRNDRRAERISAAIKWHHEHQDAAVSTTGNGGYRSVASELGRASDPPDPVDPEPGSQGVDSGTWVGGSGSIDPPTHDPPHLLDAVGAVGSTSTPDPVAVPERPFALPVDEFIALEREHREPILASKDGRAAVGRNSLVLLGALGGHGKTTLGVDVFLHMAAGVDYPPWLVPRPVSILMIENEGPEELFAEKLKARLAHFPHELKARLDVCTFDWGGFSLADDAHRARLTAEIADKGYDLVFGDPLDALGIEGVGSPEDTRRFLALMKETGLNKTVAWWLNTHPRKEETKEALNEISGAWGGKPDTVFLLRMLEDDRTQLRQPKLRWARRGKGPTLLFAFDPDTEAFSFIREQNDEERDYVAEVRALLADGEWRTIRDIASPVKAGGIGANEKIVRKVLEQHPDEFESRTGDEAKALGRKSQATLWQFRREDEQLGLDEGEGIITLAETEAATVALRERTGRIVQPLTDVIAEARRMRGEPSGDEDE